MHPKLFSLHFNDFGKYVFVLVCSIVTVLLWTRMYGGNRLVEGTILPPLIIPAVTASFFFLKFRRWWIGIVTFIAAVILVYVVAILSLTPQIAPDAFSPVAISVLLYVVLPTLFMCSALLTGWILFCFWLARRSLVFPAIAAVLAGSVPIVYFAAVYGAASMTGVPAKIFVDQYGRRYGLTTLALRRRDPRLCFGDEACERVLDFTSKFPSNCTTISPTYMRQEMPLGLWLYFDFSRCEPAEKEQIESTFDDEYAIRKLMYRKMRNEVRTPTDCASIGPAGVNEMAICHALASGEATKCEGLTNDDAKSECYLNMAIKYRNTKFCTSRYKHFEDASCYILVELAKQEFVK